MQVVWSMKSTNGRWGAEIVSASAVERWPARGHLRPLGQRAGVVVYKFSADESAETWVLPGEDYSVVEGAILAWKETLQSSRVGSIVICGSSAVLKWRGYKGRSAGFTLVREGREQELPTSIALALGLIEPAEPVEEIAPPPPPSGALQAALSQWLAAVNGGER